MSNRRIAIAGFQHETNTFAPSHAGVAEFRKADSWPGLLRGQEVVDDTRDMNLPVAGAGLNVAAQGWLPCELENLPYHNLRPGIRLGPLGATC